MSTTDDEKKTTWLVIRAASESTSYQSSQAANPMNCTVNDEKLFRAVAIICLCASRESINVVSVNNCAWTRRYAMLSYPSAIRNQTI